MMDELRFVYDPNVGDDDFKIPTEGYAVIREGKSDWPWAVGDEVTVIPFGPTLGEWTEPKLTWRMRLRRWWRANQLTVHRGPCDHSECEGEYW